MEILNKAGTRAVCTDGVPLLSQALAHVALWDAALRAKWDFALELDPSKAHNQLCLINDYRNVPKAHGHNVYWLECEDG
jgi:hypothetical protein